LWGVSVRTATSAEPFVQSFAVTSTPLMVAARFDDAVGGLRFLDPESSDRAW
jgi:hypothetical protein